MSGEKDVMSDSTPSVNSFGEVVYGSGPGSVVGGASADETRVMSERVQNLAASIYKEFERMIHKYEEDSVKDLMPLVVNVLESLDLAYLEKEEHEVELELLKEDNEQLVTQYEREKQLRRGTEQRFLELEDHFEGKQKEQSDKVESLESIVRMLELKSKNAADHVVRLEERESEAKQEFSKLHERYTELFKTHMDYMERTKFLMGNDKFDLMNSSMVSSTMNTAALSLLKAKSNAADDNAGQSVDVSSFAPGNFASPTIETINVPNELQDWPDDVFSGAEQSDGSSRNITPRIRPPSAKDQHQQNGDDSLGADLTGALVDPAEFASAELNMPSSSNDQTWSSDDDDATASTSGMGKEVENLIKENSELLETKNALNIVKNDLIAKIDELSSEQEILREEIRSLETIRTKMNERIKELEIELKETKRQFEEALKNKEDEDGVPMAQRKRFTRIEMARVLTERNQYKEKLMELQEAIRWTEMMRAAKSGDASLRRKKGSIWEFFSGLFNSSSPSAQQTAQNIDVTGIDVAGIAEQELKPMTPPQAVPRSVPSIKGLSDPVVRRKAEKTNPIDFLDTEYYSEKRANERREQYKLVKAHVKKDESGRLQAYGWSIPASGAGQSTIPVPIYSKPLMDQEPNLRIWCATGTSLQGGKTKDGAFINALTSTTVEKPSKTPLHIFETTSDHSCLTWICNSAHGQSQVSVVDADNPSEILDSFVVCSSHLLCIESVSGVMQDDYLPIVDPDSLCKAGELKFPNAEPNIQIGHTTFVVFSSCGDGITFSGPEKSPRKEKSSSSSSGSPRTTSPGTPASNEGELDKQCKEIAVPQRLKDLLASYENMELSTACPTVWMGSQNGFLFVHSAVCKWSRCLLRLKLEDAILCTVHYKGRLFAALANGTVVVFFREFNGEWSTKGYFVILIGKPQHSVRCLKVACGKVWCGYKNLICVIDPESLKVENCFVAHPRKESQVRQLCSVGDGVWCSIRLDSTLRLYHAKTYQHLQDIDISPYVTQMIGTSKLGFSFVRITALLVTLNTLWIGTGNGVIISVPFINKDKSLVSLDKSCEEVIKRPGSLIRVYQPSASEQSCPSSQEGTSSSTCTIPYCSMAQAQLSFHGHKDAVKFIIAVRGCKISTSKADAVETKEIESETVVKQHYLILSGGDGYIDFRIGEEDSSMPLATPKRDLSHLIIWKTELQKSTISLLI